MLQPTLIERDVHALRLLLHRRERVTLLVELALILLVLTNIARERMELRRQVRSEFSGLSLVYTQVIFPEDVTMVQVPPEKREHH